MVAKRRIYFHLCALYPNHETLLLQDFLTSLMLSNVLLIIDSKKEFDVITIKILLVLK